MKQPALTAAIASLEAALAEATTFLHGAEKYAGRPVSIRVEVEGERANNPDRRDLISMADTKTKERMQ